MKFEGRGILLDIEGTTSSVTFVYDVLFPYVRRELGQFLVAQWNSPELRAALEWVARDAGMFSVDAWLCQQSPEKQRDQVYAELMSKMDADAKTTGLKQVQGLVWHAGYESRELQAHVYSDVPEAMRRWHERGIELRIYSSGSVAAQKLFFAHTLFGDMSHFLSGFYDTTTGPKRSPESYRAIADQFASAPDLLLFLSDVPAELHAAHTAGWQTALVIRSDEPPEPWDGEKIQSFDELP